ncbi:MAG: enoyl-CoA hydratase/isomerase family protein [Ilumatobacteraceae bacterium]
MTPPADTPDADTTSDLVVADHPAAGVTRLTLNRPERLNTLTVDLVAAMHDTLDAIDADHDCRVVILTGAGRGFCAGLDLNGYGTVPGTEGLGEAQRGMAVQQHIAEVVHHIRAIRQPVIAAINGAVAGGGLAWACASDIRYCAESTRLGTAFIRLGISGCDMGLSWTLPRLIGVSRAWELIYTGRVIDAAEAERLGIVSRSVADADLMPTVLGVAAEIVANSPFGVWMTKETLWANLETPSLRAGIDIENRTQILASFTEDSRRAMSGFLAGERPDWQNK